MPSRRLFITGLILTPLAGCSIMGSSGGEIRDVPINTGSALGAVNAYRAAHGMSRLSHDARLDEASLTMAHLMARQDKSNPRAHNARALSGRITAAGMTTFAGAENLGSGYTSFSAAMAGWKGSRDHDRNLLNPHVTRIGFAHVTRSDGKWRNFWVMVLARPQEDGRPNL